MADRLAAKLARIMGKIDRIPKNGYNDFHKYHYATEADVAEHCRKLMSEEKVVLIPNIKEVTQVERAKGEARVSDITRLRIEFTFYDGESDEKISFMVVGDAQDAVDKGVYKAFTGAQKYALMKSFLIPTGDDPEQEGDGNKGQKKKDPLPPSQPKDVSNPPVPSHQERSPNNISDAQRKRFYAIAKGAGKTDDEMKAYLKSLGIEHSRDIPKAKYDDICQWAEFGDEQPPEDDNAQ